MTVFRGAWCFGPLLVVALSVGCATNAEPVEASESQVVVGLGELRDKVTVHPDRLEIDADAEPALRRSGVLAKIDAWARAADKSVVEPVYLVGDRQTGALRADGALEPGLRNPTGYLRRAISYARASDGKLIVVTEPATLAEAVEEVKKSGLLVPKAGDTRPLGAGDVVDFGRGDFDATIHHAFGDEATGVTIDLSGTELFRKQTLLGGEARIVLTKGRIELRPVIDARVSIERFEAQEARALLSTDATGELEIEGSVENVFQLGKGDILFHRSWGFTAGSVPVSLSVDVSWRCDVGFGGEAIARLGATASGSVRAGAELDGGALRGVLDRSAWSLDRVGPHVDGAVDVKGECHLITRLGVQLFDAVGPDTEIDMYARLTATSGAEPGGDAGPRGDLVAGITASVGGSLRPFGVSLGSIRAPVFRHEHELFSGPLGRQ